eukprot:CAMPEP_0117520438 /NCGR_PEP_ID=MMETSP0784-20121206/33168_1 /TAXON_ID=39447 /ORGANISM="" /LENGTH=35 /DNA_ID=CAMNT_0005316431 /DNA_START=56 /DNA_END=159 /DNA_ORIENTATION=+
MPCSSAATAFSMAAISAPYSAFFAAKAAASFSRMP